MTDPFKDLDNSPNWVSRWQSRKNDYFGRAFPVACKDTGETARNYRDYLLTEHWKNVKGRFFKSKTFKNYQNHRHSEGCGRCFVCLKNDKLHVHHKSYRRLGKEHIGRDLVALCSVCHKDLHGKYDKLMVRDPSRSKTKTLKYIHERLPEMKERIKKNKALRKERRRLNKIKKKRLRQSQKDKGKARRKNKK